MAGLSWPRNCIEPPHPFPGLDIVSIDKPPGWPFAREDAQDRFVFDDQWGGGEPVPLFVIARLGLPQHLPTLGIQGDEVGVLGGQENFAPRDSYPSMLRPAPDTARHLRGEFHLEIGIAPQHLPG